MNFESKSKQEYWPKKKGMTCLASRQTSLGSQGGHWLFSLKGYVWDPEEYGVWSKEIIYRCRGIDYLKPKENGMLNP